MSIYSERAKSSCEIKSEAKVLTYLSFDDGLLVDRSLHQTEITSVGSVSIKEGVIKEGLEFSRDMSILILYGYIAWEFANHPFAISLWVRPYSWGGTIVHISNRREGGGYCSSLLGLTSTGTPSAIYIYKEESLFVCWFVCLFVCLFVLYTFSQRR